MNIHIGYETRKFISFVLWGTLCTKVVSMLVFEYVFKEHVSRLRLCSCAVYDTSFMIPIPNHVLGYISLAHIGNMHLRDRIPVQNYFRVVYIQSKQQTYVFCCRHHSNRKAIFEVIILPKLLLGVSFEDFLYEIIKFCLGIHESASISAHQERQNLVKFSIAKWCL